MDFSWSDAQTTFRNDIIDFAQAKLNDDVIVRDKSGEFSRENWNRCAEFGIQGMSVPENLGGRDTADILTAMFGMEAMGYACHDMGLLFGLNAQMWTVQLPITQFGTDDQKQRFLPKLCSGEWIGAHAISEPAAGSDVFSMKMTAEKCDGGYRLNGTKCMVTLAPEADVSLVFASTNQKLGKWGVTAFLIEKETPGYATSPSRDKMGLRTVPIGEINLENCLIREENRLGAEGSGFALSQHSLEFERCCILASQIGAMEHQLETAVQRSKDRVQFGQAIGKFQSVSNRVADMKLRLETARLLLYKVAWLKQQNKPAMLEASILKLYLSECFVESSMDAIRIHGGSGYLSDTGVERSMRDAIGGVLYAGTSDIQRNIIAGLMGL